MSPPVGEVARSAGGADHKTRALTTLRAGAQLNDSMALKGCGGKQEFSPTFFIYCRYDFFSTSLCPLRGVISKVRRIIQIFVEMHKLNRDNAQIPSLNIINPCKTHLKHGIMISYRRTCPLPGAAAKLFRRTQENVQDSYQENPQPHSYSYGS